MFRNVDGVEVFLRVLIGLLLAVLVGFLLYGLFHLVDAAGVTPHADQGTVLQTSYEPAHTSTTYVMSGKVMVPITTTYPDSWSARVRLNSGTKVTCDISHNQYDHLYRGMSVPVLVVSGRISNWTYCDSIKS